MRLLDLFCGAGGAAMGYHHSGFDEIVGIDNQPQPNYPFDYIQADALEYLSDHGQEYAAIHASPPCQAYSIMHNLPWLRGRDYPLLILPTVEMLEALGKPYVVENVMGARHGSKTLKKRGLEAHGLKGGWLCGAMFGKPFYRHRLFATNWFWLAPGHPKHIVFSSHRESGGRDSGGLTNPGNGGLNIRPGYEKVPFSYPTIVAERLQKNGRPKDSMIGLSNGMPGAQLTNSQAASVGQAKGWQLAAEAMGIDWMKREELTQAIPPCYTEFIGRHLLRVLEGGDDELEISCNS